MQTLLDKIPNTFKTLANYLYANYTNKYVATSNCASIAKSFELVYNCFTCVGRSSIKMSANAQTDNDLNSVKFYGIRRCFGKMADIMVATTNLTKKYGSVCAVNDVSISVERGAIIGLVGKNGAGKTTLIRVLTGLVKPTSGTFVLLPNQSRSCTDVAAIVERPSIYTDMTAMGNITTQCKLLGLTADNEYLKKTIELVGLNPNSQQLVKKYSLGMKQRLAIAMTLIGKPQLLILDEPTNGLDPQGMHDMREIFLNLNREFGTTIIISSHILGELSKLATEYLFMDKGRIIKQISAQELEIVAQKRIRVTVDNVEKAKTILEEFGKTVITSPNNVELTGEAAPTQILLTLAQNGVSASNIVNVGDDLEEFFIELVQNNGKGGVK